MKISVEVNGYEFQEHFEEFYENVRMARQMKNGRAVDRKAVRKIWNGLIRSALQDLIEEEVYNIRSSEDDIEHIVNTFDLEAEQKLYKMVKEYS